MIKLHKIDADGFLLFGEDLHVNEGEPVPESYVATPLPHNTNGQLAYYRPKWQDGKWIESKTQEEIEAEQLLASLQPSPQELADADLEIKMLTLLLEMEVI